jgi:hypothetical protein
MNKKCNQFPPELLKMLELLGIIVTKKSFNFSGI